MQRINPNLIHQVTTGDRDYLFHLPTSALFELEEVSTVLLGHLTSDQIVNSEEVIALMSEKYMHGDIMAALQDFSSIGLLDNKDIKPLSFEQINNDVARLNTLVLNVNTGCNLGCSYCYKEDLAIPSAGVKMSKNIAFDSVDRLFEEAFDPRVNIVFFGGEPLSNFRLIQDVVSYSEDKAWQLNVKCDFSLTTNATLLTPNIIEYLNRHNVGISVSIDGPKAVHDHARKTVKGRGTYDLVVAKIKLLLDNYTARPVGARVTLSAGNTDIVSIHKHLRDELGFYEVGYAPVTSGDIDIYNLSPEELSIVFEGFKGLGRQYLCDALENRNSGFANLHQLLSDLHKGTRKVLPCGAGTNLLAVDHNGDLHLCHRFTGSDIPTLGNVKTGLNHNGITELVRDAVDMTDRDCGSCRIRGICAGGCYHESYARYGDLHHPVYHYCDLLRDWVDFGIEVYVEIMDKNPDFFDKHIMTRTVDRTNYGFGS